MSKCKNCIHFQICDLAYFHGGCIQYKDKSLFVKLPCKPGSPVHFVVEDVDSKIFDGKVYSVTFEQNTTWIYCRYDNGLTYHHTVDDIGKTLFFVKKEAEKALAERRQANVKKI